MTPEQSTALIETLIDLARKTHSGEVTFAEFAAFLRTELNQLEPSSTPQTNQHQ